MLLAFPSTPRLAKRRGGASLELQSRGWLLGMDTVQCLLIHGLVSSSPCTQATCPQGAHNPVGRKRFPRARRGQGRAVATRIPPPRRSPLLTSWPNKGRPGRLEGQARRDVRRVPNAVRSPSSGLQEGMPAPCRGRVRLDFPLTADSRGSLSPRVLGSNSSNTLRSCGNSHK